MASPAVGPCPPGTPPADATADAPATNHLIALVMASEMMEKHSIDSTNGSVDTRPDQRVPGPSGSGRADGARLSPDSEGRSPTATSPDDSPSHANAAMLLSMPAGNQDGGAAMAMDDEEGVARQVIQLGTGSFRSVSKPGGKRKKGTISYEELEQLFTLREHEAAAKLGICQTYLKRICRNLGINRWPFRKVQSGLNRAKRMSATSSPTVGKAGGGVKKQAALKTHATRVQKEDAKKPPSASGSSCNSPAPSIGAGTLGTLLTAPSIWQHLPRLTCEVAGVASPRAVDGGAQLGAATASLPKPTTTLLPLGGVVHSALAATVASPRPMPVASIGCLLTTTKPLAAAALLVSRQQTTQHAAFRAQGGGLVVGGAVSLQGSPSTPSASAAHVQLTAPLLSAVTLPAPALVLAPALSAGGVVLQPFKDGLALLPTLPNTMLTVSNSALPTLIVSPTTTVVPEQPVLLAPALKVE